MILITGSTGLIGSAASFFYLDKKRPVIGIDNNLRRYFFGKKGSNMWKELILKKDKNYKHFSIDIRNKKKIFKIFKKYGKKIKSIIHTAAQPSHDWASKEPLTDFEINANGTLNLLEAFRLFCPNATFVFTSTNKVYGDNPNFLPLEEKKLRYELKKNIFILKKELMRPCLWIKQPILFLGHQNFQQIYWFKNMVGILILIQQYSGADV